MILTAKKPLLSIKMHICFRPLRMRVIFYFFLKICLRHVQTTCRNLYVMHDIIVLRNFLMAGFRKYHLKVKKWNFSDFDSQKAVTEHNNAYSFSPIANACYIFFAKFVFVMCRRHVVTYKSCTASQRCIIFKWQGFVNTTKKMTN